MLAGTTQQVQPTAPARPAVPAVPNTPPKIVSNLSGAIKVMDWVPNATSFVLRAVTPDAQRRALKAAQMLLAGQVAHRPHYCAQSVMDALVAAGIPISQRGHANQLDELLQQQGFELVTDGTCQPGDIAGWNRYGTGTMGKTYGHIGFITNAGMTAPIRRAVEAVENHPATAKLQQIRARLGRTIGVSTSDLDALRPSFNFERNESRRLVMEERIKEAEGQFTDFLKALMPDELGNIIDMLYR